MSWSDGSSLTSQTYALEKLRAQVPISLHGVSLNLGSAERTNFSYLERLKTLTNQIQPFVVSDHLCFTGIDGNTAHDLLPLPYVPEAIDNVVRKIQDAQEFLARPLLIENVSSYLTWKQSEMTEWEFLSEIVKRSGCGILLDINNVYVSAKNHGFDPKAYLSNIPHSQVGQIHLAGHTIENGFLIDTHDEPVCEEVWGLLGWYNDQYGAPNVMIERDGNFPEWSVLENELKQIQQTLNQESSRERIIIDSTSALSF